MHVWQSLVTGAALLGLALAPGCGLGPRSLHRTRLPYNEAVKVTTEEQLLLNVVRLRYSDNPSSLAISTIAAQFRDGPEAPADALLSRPPPPGRRSAATAARSCPAPSSTRADRPTLSYTPAGRDRVRPPAVHAADARRHRLTSPRRPGRSRPSSGCTWRTSTGCPTPRRSAARRRKILRSLRSSCAASRPCSVCRTRTRWPSCKKNTTSASAASCPRRASRRAT